MAATASSENEILRGHLLDLIRRQHVAPSPWPPSHFPITEFHVATAAGSTTDPTEPIDVVVTINEINDQHGTGPLVKRIFQGRRNIFSIRSRDDWGVQDFGDWNVAVPQGSSPRAECFRNILRVLGGRKVQRVVCIPYLRDEVISAIAIK